MKIALVITGGLHPSGREQIIPALLTFVARLAESHDVHAFALRHLARSQTYRLHGAVVHDLGRPRGRWRQWRALRDALVANGPFDIVHGYWADPAGLLTVLAARRLGLPSVVTCDSGEFVSLPDRAYGLQRGFASRAAVRFACRNASVVHVTSEYMQRLAEEHGITSHRVPLGIDTASFEPPRMRHDSAPWKLLQVASLNLVKDQSTLLRALAHVRQTHDVHLDLVGEDTLAGRLQREASSVGLADAVTFHGFVEQAQLRDLYASAHMYVQSSQHEAAGVAVLEAAASGLPIVGTRVGYVSDWEKVAAVAVPVGDADALACAIVTLITNPERRRALAHAARERVRAYDASLTTAGLVGLYEIARATPARRRA
jgi:glycosyltransferase involved in cell wall biosynthesis